MNLTQWILIIVPYLAAYVWFVFTAENAGRVHRPSNALFGLLVIPLATVLVPAIAWQAAAGGFRKRQYGVMAGALAVVLVLIGYAVVVYMLRADTMPPPAELPLER
jgi:hypothetical protein